MKQLVVGYVRVPQWGAPHKVELRSPACLWLIEETFTVLTGEAGSGDGGASRTGDIS